MARHSSSRRAAGALGASVALFAALTRDPEPACAQRSDWPSGPIEIVLDASSGMRGRIGDAERMTVAREFVRSLHAELAAAGTLPPMGLRVYGAGSPRAQRDCQDTRLALSTTDRQGDITKAVSEVQPLGVGALAFALEQALADTARTYVLVTSGSDGCGADACAVWRRVFERGSNRHARLHVVALGVEAAEVERLKCLSRAGSGSFLNLTSPTETAAAASRLALILKNQGILDVRLSIGPAEPFTAPVRVLVPRTRELVAAFPGRGPQPLRAGMYTVILETAPAITIDRVMILPGETVTVERSSFGRLAVEMRDAEDRPLRMPLSVRSGSGRREVRFAFTGDPMVLQAGSYDVIVDLGDSIAVRRDVAVAAGRTSRVAMGGTGAILIVSPEFPDPPPTRAILSRRGAAPDTILLGAQTVVPAGTYRLRVETMPVYVSDAVTIGYGESTTVELPPLGALRVELMGPEGAIAGVTAQLREPMTGETYGTIVTGETRLVMPGAYAVELQTVPPQTIDNVVVTIGNVTVRERRGISRVTVAAPAGGGVYRLELLRAAGGPRLGEATGSAPSLAVMPGTYYARVRRGSTVLWEGRIAVASDKTARIDLPRP